MTNANTIASKLFVGVVAIAMALSLVAPAQAATEAELQAQIDQLMATINGLQSQLGEAPAMTGGSSASVCPYAWTRSLSTGATGADVMALQKFLNADANTMVAATGVGSAGMETDYFGGLTAAAVSNFQVMYRDEILTPVGLVNPTGYFGPSTMAKANALCASAPVVVDDTDDTDDTSDDSDDTMDDVSDLQGEGELVTFEWDDDETEVPEGAEDVVVGIMTLEAENGDLLLDRVTMTMLEVGTDNVEDEPWDVFDEFSLWVDGDKVADFDASDEDEWLDTDAGEEEFRFSGLDLILPEDDEVEVLFAVSVANSVDGSDVDGEADWTVDVTELRYFDADDVATNDDETDELDDAGFDFDIEEEGTDDGASIDGTSASPDAETLLVDEGSEDSDEFLVHVFDIEVDEDSSDLEVGDAYVAVTIDNTGNSTVISGGQKEVIDGIFMTIDGEEVEGEAVASTSAIAVSESWDDEDDSIATTTSTTVGYLFEFDQDVTLDGDTDYEVEVSIVFKGQDTNYDSGVTVETYVDGTIWEVEGLANDDELDGTDTSSEHTLSTVVPVITDVDSSVSTNEAEDAGTISFSFTIEAEDDDVVLEFTDVDGDIDGTADDIRFALTPSGANTTAALNKTSGDATVDTSGNTWTIAEGDSATFSLVITAASSSAAGTYFANLDTIGGVEVDETAPGLTLY